MTGYKVLQPSDLGRDLFTRRFAMDVLKGLAEKPRRLPSRWFYDDVGSRLFQQICDLEEYYLTRVETEILTRNAAAIVGHADAENLDIVDLGAGDGRKTSIILDAAPAARYVPIDISEAAMGELVPAMRRRFPSMEVGGIVSEYFDGLHWLAGSSGRRSLVLFLGSNIGNFNHGQARDFLRHLWDALNHGDLVLVGFDLKKDIEVLLAAYNDSQGITAQFNLNLLTRVNRELQADFSLENFRHFATYNVFSGAMESYLVAQEGQSVRVGALQQTFDFEPWEPIHTEYSYKYLTSDVAGLAADTGYAIVDQYFDARHWFVDSLWQVIKQP
jgi:L-histidine N-alpha-methyltransferase